MAIELHGITLLGDFNETDKHVLAFALRIAAERFEANAQQSRDELGQPALAQIFTRQADEARTFAYRFEETPVLFIYRDPRGKFKILHCGERLLNGATFVDVLRFVSENGYPVEWRKWPRQWAVGA